MKITITTDRGTLVHSFEGQPFPDRVKQAIERAHALDLDEARAERNEGRTDGWREAAPETAPRYERGCDYGTAHRLVLAHGKGLRLVWQKGKSWSRGISSGYYPSQLILYGHSKDAHNMGLVLLEGGRFTRKRLDEKPTTVKLFSWPTVASFLEHAFGVDSLPDLRPGRTFILKGEG